LRPLTYVVNGTYFPSSVIADTAPLANFAGSTATKTPPLPHETYQLLSPLVAYTSYSFSLCYTVSIDKEYVSAYICLLRV